MHELIVPGVTREYAQNRSQSVIWAGDKRIGARDKPVDISKPVRADNKLQLCK
jgi:hypothetical protein